MTESTPPATELTSQYLAQVVGDLDRNVKEQERIRAEISALQEQLLALQHDHTVLVSMQRALGPDAPTQPAQPEDAAAPGAPSTPRRKRPKAATESGTGKRSGTKKAAGAQGGTTAAKKPKARPKAQPKGGPIAKTEASKSAQPTLVELIRRHLGEQSEPRSAAEIATALGQANPERRIKSTVVRTSLEGLVAKSQAHRTKQGSSVFYTAPDAPEPTEPPRTETQYAAD
ncbi:hypothetical protein ACFYO0_03880 [Streptomyces sp. NPDC006365]|uniref:hypothetical protein n=1 Tax=Streptomyces sp. NPDC006365 TaxID=3364744 RepID=UPI0036A2E544